MIVKSKETFSVGAFVVSYIVTDEFELQIRQIGILAWRGIPSGNRHEIPDVRYVYHLAGRHRRRQVLLHIFLPHLRERLGQGASHVMHCVLIRNAIDALDVFKYVQNTCN